MKASHCELRGLRWKLQVHIGHIGLVLFLYRLDSLFYLKYLFLNTRVQHMNMEL